MEHHVTLCSCRSAGGTPSSPLPLGSERRWRGGPRRLRGRGPVAAAHQRVRVSRRGLEGVADGAGLAVATGRTVRSVGPVLTCRSCRSCRARLALRPLRARLASCSVLARRTVRSGGAIGSRGAVLPRGTSRSGGALRPGLACGTGRAFGAGRAGSASGPGRAAYGPAGIAAAAGRARDRFPTKGLYLPGQQVARRVGVLQLAAEMLHGKHNPRHHRAQHQGARHRGGIPAAPPPLFCSQL